MDYVLVFIGGAIAGAVAYVMGAWDWIKELSVAAYKKLTDNLR